MSESWPAWAMQPVEIAPADPRWVERAATLIAALEPVLARWLDGRIEHVGSTAVAGLDAKPVIDLMAPVQSLDRVVAADEPLAAAGWELVPPELDDRPWRRFYVLPEADRRAAHLHLVEAGHTAFVDALRFRDELRRRPELATAYAELKREAARANPDDREAYTDAKTTFVRSVLGGRRR